MGLRVGFCYIKKKSLPSRMSLTGMHCGRCHVICTYVNSTGGHSVFILADSS